MFLGPHHFQQHDRFLLHTMAALHHSVAPYSYGLHSLEIDNQALSEGKFALQRCDGIFADGTPFSLPQDSPLPEPLEISPELAGSVISVALPFTAHATKEIAESRSRESFARFQLQHQQINDTHSPDSDSQEAVFTASLWVRLQFAGSDETAYHTVPIARILDCREDGTVTT